MHQHEVTEWIYDEQNGYEYKECSSCGELLDKRVPNIEYSDLKDVIEGSEQDKEDKINNENEENKADEIQKDNTSEAGKATEKIDGITDEELKAIEERLQKALDEDKEKEKQKKKNGRE